MSAHNVTYLVIFSGWQDIIWNFVHKALLSPYLLIRLAGIRLWAYGSWFCTGWLWFAWHLSRKSITFKLSYWDFLLKMGTLIIMLNDCKEWPRRMTVKNDCEEWLRRMTAKITAKNACNKLLRRRTARKDCKIKNCSFLDPGCANLLILLFINDLPLSMTCLIILEIKYLCLLMTFFIKSCNNFTLSM